MMRERKRKFVNAQHKTKHSTTRSHTHRKGNRDREHEGGGEEEETQKDGRKNNEEREQRNRKAHVYVYDMCIENGKLDDYCDDYGVVSRCCCWHEQKQCRSGRCLTLTRAKRHVPSVDAHALLSSSLSQHWR